MIQSKKVWTISAGILSGILLLVLLFRRSSPEMFLSVFSFPLLPLAKILRSLSLKGGFYNVLAWLLYLDLSLSPLYVLFLRRKKERLLREVLLGAGSALLFYSLYQLMNPRNLSALYGDFGGEGIFAMLMGGVLYSILFFKNHTFHNHHQHFLRRFWRVLPLRQNLRQSFLHFLLEQQPQPLQLLVFRQ